MEEEEGEGPEGDLAEDMEPGEATDVADYGHGEQFT